MNLWISNKLYFLILWYLSESKAQDILGFICQLTQTALNKSAQSLLILIDKDDELLSTLDEALWSYDAASFIPHQRLLHATISEPKDASKSVQENNEALAPVLLSSYMPADFKGIVLNTTIHPKSFYGSDQ